MDPAAFLPYVPHLAIVVAVNLGGAVAKRWLWTEEHAKASAVVAALRATMAFHAPLVGVALALIPGLLTGTAVQRGALGLLLGAFAATIYDRVRAWLEVRKARASAPPEPTS